eukprot:7714646-Heterocapsa_arctica.AAC.1
MLRRFRMQRVPLRQAEELLPVIRAGPHPCLIMPAENVLLVVAGREETSLGVAAISSRLRGLIPSARK